MIFLGVTVWGLLMAELFYVTEARSRTPLINNIKRAMNDCIVRGRLAVEGDSNALTFNSRILCSDSSVQAEASGTLPNGRSSGNNNNNSNQ